MFFSERGFINPETISSFYMNSTYIVYSQEKAIEVCKTYKKRMAEYCSTEIMAFIYGMKIFENKRIKTCSSINMLLSVNIELDIQTYVGIKLSVQNILQSYYLYQ